MHNVDPLSEPGPAAARRGDQNKNGDNNHGDG